MTTQHVYRQTDIFLFIVVGFKKDPMSEGIKGKRETQPQIIK